MYKPYGIIPPIITPFDEEGKVNYDSLAKMSVYLVENGVHGLFPFGTTGEFYAVSDEEYVKALETVRDAVKGMTNCYGKPIQLMAGCSHITTRGVIRLIHLVEQVGGYDAVSVLTPCSSARRRMSCTSTTRPSPKARRCPCSCTTISPRPT